MFPPVWQMPFSIRLYSIISVVTVVSLLAAFFLPIPEWARGIVSLPAAAGLAGALFQIFRDRVAHERAVDLQQKEQMFNLGIASHMANVAFDKHIEFCELYIQQMQAGLGDLLAKGPTIQVLKFCGKLGDTRFRYRAWITSEVWDRLLLFEVALRKLGASASVLEHSPVSEGSSQAADQMDKLFQGILALKEGTELDKEAAASRVIRHLQDFLGIEELSRLRASVLAEVSRFVGQSSRS